MIKKIRQMIAMICLLALVMPSTLVSAYEFDSNKPFSPKNIDEVHGDFYATRKVFYEYEMPEKTDFVFDGYVIIEGKRYDKESIEQVPRSMPPVDYDSITYNIEFCVYDANGEAIAVIYENIKNFDIEIRREPSIFVDAGKEVVISNYNYYSKKKDSDGDYLTWYNALFYNKIVNRKNEVLEGFFDISIDNKRYPKCYYGYSKLEFEFTPFEVPTYESLTGHVDIYRLPESKYVKSTATTIYYSDTKNDTNKVLQYKLDNGKWTSKSKFTGLKPNTKHTLSIRVKKTKDHAASKVIKVTIQTKKK